MKKVKLKTWQLVLILIACVGLIWIALLAVNIAHFFDRTQGFEAVRTRIDSESSFGAPNFEQTATMPKGKYGEIGSSEYNSHILEENSEKYQYFTWVSVNSENDTTELCLVHSEKLFGFIDCGRWAFDERFTTDKPVGIAKTQILKDGNALTPIMFFYSNGSDEISKIDVELRDAKTNERQTEHFSTGPYYFVCRLELDTPDMEIISLTGKNIDDETVYIYEAK